MDLTVDIIKAQLTLAELGNSESLAFFADEYVNIMTFLLGQIAEVNGKLFLGQTDQPSIEFPYQTGSPDNPVCQGTYLQTLVDKLNIKIALNQRSLQTIANYEYFVGNPVDAVNQILKITTDALHQPGVTFNEA